VAPPVISAGYAVGVDGGFGAKTQRAVEGFQAGHGLIPDGVIGTQTWTALLRYRIARITWTTRHGVRLPVAHATRAGLAPSLIASVPKSARRRARRNEIAGAGGRAGIPGR
jgi:Putative peptidoglycan binding domain